MPRGRAPTGTVLTTARVSPSITVIVLSFSLDTSRCSARAAGASRRAIVRTPSHPTPLLIGAKVSEPLARLAGEGLGAQPRLKLVPMTPLQPISDQFMWHDVSG